MPARYTITASKEDIQNRFNAIFQEPYTPNYNAAPTQLLPIITNENPNQIVLAKFGFIPEWAADEKIGVKLLNARSETILEQPTFKIAMKYRRCLVIMDGFYEWKPIRNGKEPYRITLKKGEPFSVAGIWNKWRGIHTFAIITCKPNAIVSSIHDRMPVILPESKEQSYLESQREAALNILQPFAASKMKVYRVSTDVNTVKNNSSSLIDPM